MQGELERLAHEDYLDADGHGAHATARLSSLKAEFTSLMHEVRKRQARARRMQDKQLRSGRRRAEVSKSSGTTTRAHLCPLSSLGT